MKLWLVRHARPLVQAGICYGATDMPADEDATRASASVLALQLPRGARVMTSPRKRCTQLAAALQRLRPDLPHICDQRLVEFDFGHWEGWRWNEIPRPAIDAWTAQFGGWRFGGRDSVQELLDRVAGAWVEARALAQPTVWITHAGVIRAASLLSRGIVSVERGDEWPTAAPDFGQWSCLP